MGEGKEGNACPQTPRFWKTRSPTNGAPDWCGMVILIDKCIKFVWMITVITRAWLAYVISESFFKNLSAAAFKLSYAKIKHEPAYFDSKCATSFASYGNACYAGYTIPKLLTAHKLWVEYFFAHRGHLFMIIISESCCGRQRASLKTVIHSRVCFIAAFVSV